MEETCKYLTKTSSSKQPTDPHSLHIECQNQVDRLNSKLTNYLQTQRNQQFKVILPNINTLSQQITSLKENISQEITSEERQIQKIKLSKAKESLIKRIEQYSHKIEKYKQELRILTIDKEQLQRQYEENKKIIQKEQTETQNYRTSTVSQEQNIIQKIANEIQIGRKLMSNQISLPSVFSKISKANQSTHISECSSPRQIKESRQSQVDELFLKIKKLQSDNLALQLVKCAKAGNGELKNIFKGFNTNMKIEQFLKQKQLKKVLAKLQRKKQY